MRLTKLFGLVVFSTILGLNFTSCSDDDDVYSSEISAVVGTWVSDDAKSGTIFEFTDAFKEGKSEDELKAFTEEVNALLDKQFGNAVTENKESSILLTEDSEYIFNRKSGETEGTFKYMDGKSIALVMDGNVEDLVFTLDGYSTMVKEIEINPEGLFHGDLKKDASDENTEEEQEETVLKAADIKSASLSFVYILKQKL